MIGWSKLINEDETNMTIAYSLETNEKCDGEIIFNKNTEDVVVSKMTSGEYNYLTKSFICPLRGRIRAGMEMGKKYMVMTG